MEKYIEPQIVIITVSTSDIITTSIDDIVDDSFIEL